MGAQRIIMMICFVLLFAVAGMAQGDVAKNLDVYGVKMVKIDSDSSDYIMTLVATLTNENPMAMRIQNGRLQVSFRSTKGEWIRLGQTKVEDCIVPGGSISQPGRKDLDLVVNVGPQNTNTVARLLEVFNVIGYPGELRQIGLQGMSALGVEHDNGWIYQDIQMDLGFKTTIQSEYILR